MVRLIAAFLFVTGPLWAQTDPLPSWNDTAHKAAILDFVAAASDPAAKGFVPEAERIAVFDNDGTLWAEQPIYFQFYFAMADAARRAAADPAWASTPALKAAAAGDIEAALATGQPGLFEILGATHPDMSVEDFTAAAADWLATARHPVTGLPFTGMVYQPMLELLAHLRAEGFETYIVSGGGLDFMRGFTETSYGVPPQNVVGSLGNATFETVDGEPEVMKEPGIFFVDDKGGKPVGIARHIGRRPVFAAGNSDGDLAMLQWSTAGTGPRFGMIVHHTDAVREWAYDRTSDIGRLDLALDAAPAAGWTVVDMAADWARIYPSDPMQ